jgi:acyl carrier protein
VVTGALVWPVGMEAAFRDLLPLLEPGEPLGLDTDLYRLGLDSLGMVGLLLAVEDLLEVTLPDDVLGPDAFATPGALLALALDPDVVGDLGPGADD